MPRSAPLHPPPLLTALHAIQDAHGHLPEAALAELADARRLGPAALDDFVSFFRAFSRTPPDPAVTRVCTGPACLLAGASERLKAPGARAVHCLGRCEGAPVVLGPGAPPEPEPPAPAYPPDHWRWLGAFAAPEALDGLLADVEAAGLAGMGGAGFPTHRKLAAVRVAPGPRKYVVANADEGEPGTFKDRYLLDRHPDEVLAGVLLACRLTGADTAFVYVRAEYAAQARLLEAILAGLAAEGLANGPEPAPGCPEVAIVRGGGAYICGEETALIASLEGRRGEPRPGPPFPAEHGLFGRPTLEQNVETLCYLKRIAENGAAWYRSAGAGRRHYAVSGAVVRPGVYEHPADTTARALLEAAGGPTGGGVAAFVPGGASTGFLPPDALDVPLSAEGLEPWGTSPGTGGVVFVPPGACPVGLAAAFLDFFAAESCGQCDPCRLGTRVLADALHALTRGQAPPPGRLAETAAAMRALSICGLGRWAPLPVTSLERHFPDLLAAHAEGRCPDGTCPVGAP
jgi:NADH:ubiquinone oxidoreductase subunit F (NADH-binding)